jgi:ABC-2 type transport system ATP-binding protein
MSVVVERPAAAAPVSRSTQPPAISLREVSKRFPVRRSWMETARHPFRREWVPVVRSVSCDVDPGEFFGVLGPNGAGKTTLFRMLTCTVLPDHGTIRVGGYDALREVRAVRSVLAAVPAEERSLNWRLSAHENLYLFGRLYGLHGAELRRRVDELLDVVELSDAGTKMVARYSSGMKQRLMIARALLGRPRILLLDEPTRSLDPLSARRLREFLKTELIGRQGCTVVLATHNSEEALELCDRVAVLDRGRLLAVGNASVLARELRGDRYRAWTRAPDHPEWRALLREAVLLAAEPGEPGADGWTPVELAFDGGSETGARVLARLARAGVPISRFEPVQVNLAELIEQVVARAEAEGAHG